MNLKSTALFLAFVPLFSFAQCIVDAGAPKRLCGGDTTRQVLNASITQGIPPYKITWSYTYEPFPGIIRAYTASDYLNDTSILNPSIQYIFPENEVTFIKIEVEDSTGVTCSDSVEITFSVFVTNLDATPKFVGEGDSIQLCMPSHSGGGFLPYQNFKWSSSEDISGSDSGDCIYTKPMYKADCYYLGNGYTGKSFRVIATDAYGCEVRDGDDVALLTTGLSENTISDQSWCFFSAENSMLHILPASQKGIVSIYDMTGKRIFEQKIQGEAKIELNNELSVSGVYIVVFEGGSNNFESKKIIVN